MQTRQWNDYAMEMFNSFMDTYYDPVKKYFFTYSDRQIHSEHAVGPEGGLYTDYWWAAQLYEMVLDVYERTEDEDMIELIYDLYEGFTLAYPDFRDNDWNDDIGWWARAAIRTYDLLGDARFIVVAKEMFDYIAQFHDDVYGGGIWWKNVDVGDVTRNEKNVATNATAVYTALRIYAATQEIEYLKIGEEIFGWLERRFLQPNGKLMDHITGDDQVIDWEWTYNQGNYAGAALEMYLLNQEPSYLQSANLAIVWGLNNLTTSSTLLYEGDGDTAGFKAIMTRNILALIQKAGQVQYENALEHNAMQAYNHRNLLGLTGYNWAGRTADIPLQSLGAGAAVAIAFQTEATEYQGIVEGNRLYEAENEPRDGVITENITQGYTSRGYVAGWIADRSFVDVQVNLINAASYGVVFKFATGAGEASRILRMNGAILGRVIFPNMGTWNTWYLARLVLPLPSGATSLSLTLDYDLGAENYMNLDNVFIETPVSESTMETIELRLEK